MKKNILYLFTFLNLLLLILMWITFTSWVTGGEPTDPMDYTFSNEFFAFSGYYNILTFIIFAISTIFIILQRLRVFLITGGIGIALYIGNIIIISIVHNNQMIFPSYISNLIIAIIVLLGYFVIYCSFIIFRYKLGFSEQTKTFQGDKLKRIMLVSNKIRLDMLRDLLEMDQLTFDTKLITFLKKFGTNVEGNYLIVNKETIPEIVNSMDEFREQIENIKGPKSKKI